MNYFAKIDINTIINFLTSAEVQENLFLWKVGFLVVSGLLAAFIVFALLRTHYMQWLFVQDAVEFFTRKPYGAKMITRAWNKIQEYLEVGAESDYKLAVIEADNMLDGVLKKMGYAGATLEERLSKLTFATLPNIEDVYQAHKMRNSVVYDPDFRLSLNDAKKTLAIYEKTFKDLQVIG